MSKYPKTLPAPLMGVPQVAAITPRNGGWSGDNQLGYEAKYGPDRRQTQTILKLDEWGPPEVWTVSLFLRGDFLNFDGFGVRARINFGAGGSTQVYECDWINGSQVSLPMNAINVEAIFQDVNVATEGRGLSLGVQLSRGTRGGTETPRYTLAERLSVPAGTVSSAIELPDFASEVYVTPVGNANVPRVYAADQFLELVRGSTSLTSASIDGTRLGLGIKLPVAGQARAVRYRNDSATEVTVNIIADLFG